MMTRQIWLTGFGLVLLASFSCVAAGSSPLAISSPLLSKANGADVGAETKIIAKEAENIRSHVAGLKAQDAIATKTLAAAKSADLKGAQEQLAVDDDKVKKMKAAVHAAAALKRAIISHSLPSVETNHQTINWGPHHGPPPSMPAAPAAVGGADAKYTQPVTKLEAHGLFAEGPYLIMALLVSILLTFCCCAFSSRPTSMSNKYDMK